MILEYLQPDASLLDGITVIIRALYYIATIGAAGLGLFAIGFGHRLEPNEAAKLRQSLLGRNRLGRDIGDQSHILQRRKRRDQIVKLKNETHMIATKLGALIFIRARQVVIKKLDRPAGWGI